MVNEIINTAKKCIKSHLCEEKNISLKELYEKDLLTKEVNPKTQKYFDENSYVNINDYTFISL